METRYLVRADYVPARADIAPPCWWFNDQTKAETFAKSLTNGKPADGVAMAYQNVCIETRQPIHPAEETEPPALPWWGEL